MSAATPALVWYCTIHRADESAEEGTCEVMALHLTLENVTRRATSSPPCEMVQRLLVDPSALVVERDAEDWPDEAIEVLAQRIYLADPIYKPPTWEDCTPDMKVWYRATARGGLDALAARREAST